MRRPALASHAAALALALASTAASATPPDDPVTRLLLERGLIAEPAAGAASAVPALPALPPVEESAFVRELRDRTSDMVIAAMNFLGVRYQRGGNSAEQGFDCSGFTRHIFELSLGLVLPRRADEQASAAGLMQVSRDELKPGDLVFFNTLRRTFSHVGIYIGDGKFIHAPRSGQQVRVEDMRYAYWSKRFTGARRAAALPQAPSATAPARGS